MIRTIVTCDNCKGDDSQHARIVTFSMFGEKEHPLDEAMADLGFTTQTFHLCGWCAGAVRQALDDNQHVDDGGPNRQGSDGS